MKKSSRSNLVKIYISLIIALAILAAINVFLPQGSFLLILPAKELPASKPVLAFVSAVIMLILYGGLGFIGLKLSQKLGFADIWDSRVTNKQRFLIPAPVGIAIVFFIFVTSRSLDFLLQLAYTSGQMLYGMSSGG